MIDAPKEIPAIEIAKAEAEMTGSERAASIARHNIFAPLKKLALPPEKELVVKEYAQAVGLEAMSEFERLQKESPVVQIETALKSEKNIVEKIGTKRQIIVQALTDLKRRVNSWQQKVSLAQEAKAVLKEEATIEEIVNELVDLRHEDERKGIPSDLQQGISISSGLIHTENVQRIGEISEVMSSAVSTNRILQELGFIPEGGSVRALFSLPIVERSEIDTSQKMADVIWGEKPTRTHPETVMGLSSETIPGVAAQIEVIGSEVNLRFLFQPEAIAKSVSATAPAAVAA